MSFVSDFMNLYFIIRYLLKKTNFGYNQNMVTIIFEAHATSEDNEAGLASGHFDANLSELGACQAKELGHRYQKGRVDAIFCSDLQRSFKTGEIAFKDSGLPIFQDSRLRECDYGDLNRSSSFKVEAEKIKRVSVPFPNGESYKQTTEKVKNFLNEIIKNYQNKTILIIGSRATQYALENLINHVELRDAVTAPWAWQPGWVYNLKSL